MATEHEQIILQCKNAKSAIKSEEKEPRYLGTKCAYPACKMKYYKKGPDILVDGNPFHQASCVRALMALWNIHNAIDQGKTQTALERLKTRRIQTREIIEKDMGINPDLYLKKQGKPRLNRDYMSSCLKHKP